MLERGSRPVSDDLMSDVRYVFSSPPATPPLASHLDAGFREELFKKSLGELIYIQDLRTRRAVCA